MRRDPPRPRGQQRVQLILDTATRLIEQDGYEALTTNAIAEAADISIGSLYQYFPDKESIAVALVQNYLQQVQSLVMDCFSDEALQKPFEQLLDDLYYPYIALHDHCRPALKLMLIYPEVCPGVSAPVSQENEAYVAHMVDFVQKRTRGKLSAEQAQLFMRTTASLLKALVSTLSEADDAVFREKFIEEYHSVIHHYWAPILGEPG